MARMLLSYSNIVPIINYIWSRVQILNNRSHVRQTCVHFCCVFESMLAQLNDERVDLRWRMIECMPKNANILAPLAQDSQRLFSMSLSCFTIFHCNNCEFRQFAYTYSKCPVPLQYNLIDCLMDWKYHFGCLSSPKIGRTLRIVFVRILNPS